MWTQHARVNGPSGLCARRVHVDAWREHGVCKLGAGTALEGRHLPAWMVDFSGNQLLRAERDGVNWVMLNTDEPSSTSMIQKFAVYELCAPPPRSQGVLHAEGMCPPHQSGHLCEWRCVARELH